MASGSYPYQPSELPDILTDLYQELKRHQYIFATSSNVDINLQSRLNIFKTAWKSCWEEASAKLRGSVQVPPGGLNLEQQKMMILSSFSEKDQRTLMKEMQKDESKFGQLEQERNQLQAQNEYLQGRMKELTSLLSQSMSDKMSLDQRHLENINDPYRPLAISEDYRHFCSKAWLDAKNELDGLREKQLDERTKCHFLSRLLEVASETAVTCVRTMFDGLSKSPGTMPGNTAKPQKGLGQVPPMAVKDQGENQEVPDDVKIAVTKYLKLRADNVETKQWREMVFERVAEEMMLSSKKAKDRLLVSENLKKYVVAGCKLAWKMAIQLPPMHFSCKGVGTSFDPSTVELAMNSIAPGPTAVVDYYVNPILLHENDVIVKGRVVLKPASRK